MAITGLNHLTLAVTDLDRSVDFYANTLGLEVRKAWDGGAYLAAGELWLCLSRDDNAHTAANRDYTHYAFDVDAGEFDDVVDKLTAAGVTQWKQNTSEGASFYFLDPDGHKLELHVGNLHSRLSAMRHCA